MSSCVNAAKVLTSAPVNVRVARPTSPTASSAGPREQYRRRQGGPSEQQRYVVSPPPRRSMGLCCDKGRSVGGAASAQPDPRWLPNPEVGATLFLLPRARARHHTRRNAHRLAITTPPVLRVRVLSSI